MQSPQLPFETLAHVKSFPGRRRHHGHRWTLLPSCNCAGSGGITVVVWRRLRPWLTQLRVEQGNPSDSEWFQWLAEEFERRKAAKVPANEQHRDWAP